MAGADRSADRPGERRAMARTAVLWDVLRPILDPGADGARAQGPIDVLDIGGGTGGLAVRVAGLGHRVRVVDPSPDALAGLARRARELGVEVEAHQGDLSTLVEIGGAASADVVLCHGVLEMVGDPDAALAAVRTVLRPGGDLSLLVAGRQAAVVARAMAGHFDAAHALLDDPAGTGRGRRYTADELAELLGRAGFEVRSVHGIRVFSDLVPGSLLDLEPGATAALLALEAAVASRADYLPLASQLHLLAR